MKAVLLTLGLLAFSSACAQHHVHSNTSHGNGTAAPQAHSPYMEMQSRAIKALSEAQISDLRHGKGMGLALSAELNGYPGPAHVLELAAQLGLSDTQWQKTQQLFDQMKAEATMLGEELIEREKNARPII